MKVRFLLAVLFVSALASHCALAANSTWGWSCKKGDAAETGFTTKGGAESAAKAHRDANPGHETVIDEVVYKATSNTIKVNANDWSKLSAEEKAGIEDALKQSGLVKTTTKISTSQNVKSVLPVAPPPAMAGGSERSSFLGIELNPLCIIRAAVCTAAEATALTACAAVGGPPLVLACQAAASAAYGQCICH